MAMRDYDEDRNDYEDYYESEGEEYEEEGEGEEYEEEEEEAPKPTKEELDYLQLRQKLKESIRKQIKKENGSSNGSSLDSKLPYDKMGSREDKSISDLKEEILHKFRDFMTRVTKTDELGSAGNRLLSGFQQAYEFIRKPPIDTKSKLINKVIVANETERLKSYVNSGCSKPNDIVQNTTNLYSCKNGLLHHISEANAVLNELEDLLADITNAIQSIYRNLSAVADLDFDVKLDEQVTYDDLEENTAFSHSQSTDITTTKTKENTDFTHLPVLMAIIYSMVKQDYLMQERIVSALDLKVSSEELESYCQMWSLRPFIDDDIMHQAWEYIH